MFADRRLPLFDDLPGRQPAQEPPAAPAHGPDERGPAADLASAAPPPDAGGLQDEEARHVSVDPSRNVVLEASAGTGKTSVLVTRYLNLLRAGVDPANILAITFTRKAAAEMRERIVSELWGAAQRSEVDRVRWRTLKSRLGDIAISTIDAFCLSLLREFPLEADLDPGFQLADETQVARLRDEALDRALGNGLAVAREDADVAMVLSTLGLTRVRRGLEHLLERRLLVPAALARTLGGAAGRLDAEQICRDAVMRLERTLDRVPGGLPSFLADGPIGHPRFAMLARDLGQLDRVAASGGAAIRNVLDRVREYFLTQQHTPRRQLAATYDAPDCASREAWRRHTAALAAVSPEVERVLEVFNRDVVTVLARGVRRLFQLAVTQYSRAMDAHASVDFSEALARAIELLRQMDEFARSRYRLESRYRHVLVDEFQDTSRAQWELVSLLVQSWAEGAGPAHEALAPSIFVVGDRKQSIYRFRDADVAVLDEAARYIEGLRPGREVRRVIARSFRAVPALTRFVNDLFRAVRQDGGRADAFRYDDRDRFPETTLDAAPQPAALGLAVAETLDGCASVVAGEIARLIAAGEIVRDRQTGLPRPIAPDDVAILFRSRESHREFAGALEARDIPSYVYRGLGFFETDEVKDVCALIRYLAEPYSSLRAAAFLRSRIVRLSDEALSRLGATLVEALLAPEPPAPGRPLADEDRIVLDLVRTSLRRWMPRVDRVPPADLLDEVLSETAYAAELAGSRVAQARENLKKMRGLIRRIQNAGYATMARLAEHLDRLSAGDESNAAIDAVGAVNLMTIHAAKGLEFPVVFLADLARGTGGIPPPIRLAAEAAGSEPGVGIGSLAPDVEREERLREQEETKRLLYVAVTRARDRLYLSSTLRNGVLNPGRGSLAEVMPQSVRELLSAACASAETGVIWKPMHGDAHRFRVCPLPAATP